MIMKKTSGLLTLIFSLFIINGLQAAQPNVPRAGTTPQPQGCARECASSSCHEDCATCCAKKWPRNGAKLKECQNNCKKAGKMR